MEVEGADDIRLNAPLVSKCMSDKLTFCNDVAPGMTQIVSLLSHGLCWLQDYFIFCAGCLVLQLAHFSLFIAKAKEYEDDPEDAFQRVVDNFIASWPMTTPTVLILALAVRVVSLKQKGIETLQPDKLQAAANTEIVCFDKTGTLTANSVSLACGRHDQSAAVTAHMPFALLVYAWPPDANADVMLLLSVVTLFAPYDCNCTMSLYCSRSDLHESLPVRLLIDCACSLATCCACCGSA